MADALDELASKYGGQPVAGGDDLDALAAQFGGAAQKPPKTGFLGRIKENVSGIGHAVMHPYKTAKSIASSVSNIDPEITKEAGEAWRKGDYGRYAADVVEGLPLIGAPIRRMEKDIRGEDYGAVAGDVATGLLAKYGPGAVKGGVGYAGEAIANAGPAATKVGSKLIRAGIKTVPGGRTALRGWDIAKALGEEEAPIPPRATPKPAPTAVPTWRATAPTGMPPSPVEAPPPGPAPSGTIPTWRQDPVVRPPVQPVPSTQRTLGPVVAPTPKPNGPVTWRGSTSYQPEATGAAPTQAPATVSATVTQNPKTVLSTVSEEAPSAPPSTPSVSTALDTPAKLKAAKAHAKTAGSKKGEPVVIPGSDTTRLAEATKAVNGWNKYIAGKVKLGDKPAAKITIDQFNKMSKTQQADLIEQIAEIKADPNIPQLALGGVVDTAPAQKAKVHKSKRGILYGPPKELRRLKKAK